MMKYFKKQMVDAVLVRTQPGAFVEGEWVKGADLADVPIRIIAIQPIKANEMKLLPEGQKVSDYVKTYAHKKLNLMPRDNDDDEADRIKVDGQVYMVFQVDRRRPLGNYHKVIMRNTKGI